ncbi:MAG: hypothetical protein JWL83_3891 [Actinomycetia bacterium]|nr:hypothetical protein [Actinomycetes bacterium]
MINKNAMDIGFEAFNRHILISRDPRDTLVSQLLYLPLQPWGIRGLGKENVDEFVRVIQEKELDPHSRSFQDLFELGMKWLERDQEWTWSNYLERFDVARELRERYDVFRLKYEDFADNNLAALSSYVGLEIEPVVPDRIEEHNGHVVRSATHGDWRNWFTPTDVDFFRPMFKAYMDAFDYDDDWTPADEPVIPTETASGYVLGRRALVEEKMATRFSAKPDWSPESVETVEEADEIRRRAEDNDTALSGVRYARLLIEGRVVPADPGAAFQYAYKAALIGHAPAMDLVEELYRDGIGTERDEANAERWAAEARKLRASWPAPAEAEVPAPPSPPEPVAPPTLTAKVTTLLRRAKRGAARRMRTARRTEPS